MIRGSEIADMSGEQLYLMHYPSKVGWGSDTDVYLVTESNLRKIIEIEVEKYCEDRKKREELDEDELKRCYSPSYDPWYTGTVGDEVFCDSDDINEVIEDVKQKRMTSVTTYSLCRDLIRLPEDYPVIVKKEHFDDTVFRIFCKRDIIVGEADFTRYFIDFRDYNGKFYDGELGVAGGRWNEFTSYTLKNVLRHESIFGDYQYELDREKKKVKQLYDRKRGIKPKELYFRDLLDETDEERERRDSREIAESEATIRRLEDYMKNPDTYDKYYDHLYDGHYREGTTSYFAQERDDTHIDHIKDWCYRWIFFIHGRFGCIWTERGNDEGRSLMTYGELFRKGDDFENLLGTFGGAKEYLAEFRYIDAAKILRYKFGDW